MTKSIKTLQGFALLTVALLFPLEQALSHIVPAYYMAERITRPKKDVQEVLIGYRLFFPSSSTSKKILWEDRLYFSSNVGLKATTQQAVPFLPMLLESSPEALLHAWRAFGLPTPSEKDLVKVYDPESTLESKLKSTIEDPLAKHRKFFPPRRLFYIEDKSVTIDQYNEAIVYKIVDEKKERKIFIRRNNFRPIAMEYACPEELYDLKGGSAEKDPCTIEFSEFSRNKKIPFRAHLKIGKRSILTFEIFKIRINPSKKIMDEFRTFPRKKLLGDEDEIIPIFHKYFLSQGLGQRETFKQ